MTQRMTLEDIARRAVDGDRDALDVLVRDLQGDIYGLALRMLWNREDAEDATQEILGSLRHAAVAIRFPQPARNLGLPGRRQLHPRRKE